MISWKKIFVYTEIDFTMTRVELKLEGSNRAPTIITQVQINVFETLPGEVYEYIIHFTSFI